MMLIALSAMVATAGMQGTGRSDGGGNGATATASPPAPTATAPAKTPPSTPTKPPATPTVPAATATPAPKAAAGCVNCPQPVCKLDKIATWSEVNSAGPQRLEIGGASGGQHVDYYPDRQIPAVSYILPKGGNVRVWHGFGSAWQGDGTECDSFDWKADTMRYAKDRQGQNHSGLVIDLRGGNTVIVSNGQNLSQKAIKDLLDLHRASQSGTVGEPTFGSGTTSGTAAAPSGGTGQPGCPPAKEETIGADGKGKDVVVPGPAIVHPWWNNGKAPFGQEQVRTKVFPGTTSTFLNMLGKVWVYQDNTACAANLESEFENAKDLPVRGLDQLRNDGLIR